jgi:hypothetical protein
MTYLRKVESGRLVDKRVVTIELSIGFGNRFSLSLSAQLSFAESLISHTVDHESVRDALPPRVTLRRARESSSAYSDWSNRTLQDPPSLRPDNRGRFAPIALGANLSNPLHEGTFSGGVGRQSEGSDAQQMH